MYENVQSISHWININQSHKNGYYKENVDAKGGNVVMMESTPDF